MSYLERRMKEQGVYSPSEKETVCETRILFLKEIIENCNDFSLAVL